MPGINEQISGLILVYSAFILAIASPGPNVLAIMSISMSVNRISGMFVAAGIALGSLTWSTLSVLGISAIISEFTLFLQIVKIFGGLYLIWLSINAFKSSFSSHTIEIGNFSDHVRSNLYFTGQGYLIMMTNPKALLAWIAIVSLGINKGSPAWVGFSIILGTFVISIIVHTLYAYVFSIPKMVEIYSKSRRFTQFIFGCFFFAAGMNLMLSQLS